MLKESPDIFPKKSRSSFRRNPWIQKKNNKDFFKKSPVNSCINPWRHFWYFWRNLRRIYCRNFWRSSIQTSLETLRKTSRKKMLGDLRRVSVDILSSLKDFLEYSCGNFETGIRENFWRYFWIRRKIPKGYLGGKAGGISEEM